MPLNRPVEIIQATGFSGIPSVGHCSSTARTASCRASSARSKSPSSRISRFPHFLNRFSAVRSRDVIPPRTGANCREPRQSLPSWQRFCGEPGGLRKGRAEPWYAWDTAIVTVQVQLPEETFSALRRSPDEMAGDLRLASAVHWYSRGLLSQERAAQMAGMDRTDFILALAREGVDAFSVDMNSLRRELADG